MRLSNNAPVSPPPPDEVVSLQAVNIIMDKDKKIQTLSFGTFISFPPFGSFVKFNSSLNSAKSVQACNVN